MNNINTNLNKGIIAGIISGVFWGLPFLVPLVLPTFSAVEVALGRFLFFGLMGLLALPRVISLLRRLSLNDFLTLVALSATGFWLYTIILFQGIRLSNGVIASLIIGILPLTITLFSKPIFNHQLRLGLITIFIGIVILLVAPLLSTHSLKSSLVNVHIYGIFLLLLALGLWTWFAIANARFLITHPEITSLNYSSTMGVLSLLCMLPIFLLSHGATAIITNPHLHAFIFWCLLLGIGASWIANIFWAYCSKNCTPSISGTLIVSETIFGLLYSFIFQHRLPYWNEWVAMILLISGVILTIRSQARYEQVS